MKNRIYNIVKECVTESIQKQKCKNYIRKIVSEELHKKIYEDGQSADTKRKAVMNSLKDPKYNHAQLAYDLYHPMDQGEKDTVRSLFSKKASEKSDNDGTIRSFSDTEINKLYQLIRKN